MKKIKKKVTTETVIDAKTLGKECFPATIDALIENAGRNNITLDIKGIAYSINLTEEQFQNYYKQDNAPNELFSLLRAQYNDFLKYTYHKISIEVELPDPLEEEGLE